MSEKVSKPVSGLDAGHPCPKCGKAMAEEGGFKGLWTCPDYKVKLNDTPPFQFKCTGMELTDEGAAAFKAELMGRFVERN